MLFFCSGKGSYKSRLAFLQAGLSIFSNDMKSCAEREAQDLNKIIINKYRGGTPSSPFVSLILMPFDDFLLSKMAIFEMRSRI